MPGKIKYYDLPDKEKMKTLGELYSMVSSLNDREEVKYFFQNLLTLSESVMVGRRIQVMKLLLSGHTYDEVREKLRVGIDTIRNVDRKLQGNKSKCKKIVARLEKEMQKKKVNAKKYPEPYSFEWIRKKYPLHFLIANAINEYSNRKNNKKSK